MSQRARTAVRWLAWIGGSALAVLLVSGVYVTFRYRPDADGTDLAMVRLHEWSGILLGPVGVALMALLMPRLMPRRAVRGVLAVFVFLVAWVLANATGRRLHWDQVGLFEVTIGHDVRGAFFLHHRAVFVLVEGREYSWTHHRNLFWFHAVVLFIVMAAVFAWAVLWSRRLRNQLDSESSAETPAAMRR